MKDVRAIVDAPLARWLEDRMRRWEDPDTGISGLSGNRLAQESGVSQGKIWNILKVGDSLPRADTLIQLAEFFEVSPLTLFRLAYLEGADAPKFQPDVQAKLAELESALQNVPHGAQVHFLESMISQVQVLQIAQNRWLETEPRKQRGGVNSADS